MNIRLLPFFLSLVFSLAGCGGYTAVTYPAVPVTDFSRIKENKVDVESFANASVKYPTRFGTSYHTIPVGEYLSYRIQQVFIGDVTMHHVKLKQFSSVCNPDSAFAPHGLCSTALTLDVDGRITGTAGSYDTGPLMIPGDITPPLTMGDPLVGYLHGVGRKVVDSAVADWVKLQD